MNTWWTLRKGKSEISQPSWGSPTARGYKVDCGNTAFSLFLKKKKKYILCFYLDTTERPYLEGLLLPTDGKLCSKNQSGKNWYTVFVIKQ